LLIEENKKKIVIDVGKNLAKKIKEVDPDYVLLTHTHPDHIEGITSLDVKVPIYLTQIIANKSKEYFKTGRYLKIIKPNVPFRIEGIKFIAHRVYHSSLAPTVCYKIDDKFLYAPDCLKFYDEKILNGIERWILDGSSLEKDIKRAGNIGHLSIRNAMKLAKKYNIPNLIVTHIGHHRMKETEFRSKIEEMGNQNKIFTEVADSKDNSNLIEEMYPQQKQKVNSPTFAYQIIWKKMPDNFLRGRTDEPKKMWHGHDVDKNLKNSWLDDLNNIKGIEIRSSEAGKSAERPAFIIMRFKSKDNDKLAGELTAKLSKQEGIYTDSDIGMENRPRICVAGKIWRSKNKEKWESWWDSLAGKIKKCVEKVLEEANLEEFKLKDYQVSKVRDDQLRDDLRLALAKISTMMDNGKTEFETLDDAKEFLKKIVRELLKRNCITFHPDEMKPRSLRVLREILKELKKEGVKLSDEVGKIIEMVKPTEPEPEFVYLKDIEKAEPDRIVLSDPLSSWTGKMVIDGKGHDADLYIGGNILSKRGILAFTDRLNEKLYPVIKKLIDLIPEPGTPYNTYIPNYRLVIEKIPLSERKKVVMEGVEYEAKDEGKAGEFGNIDFKEDDTGTGVYQLHILGLTEDGMKKVRANSKRIIQAAKQGIDQFASTMKSIIKAGAHVDIRMRPSGVNYFEGGEIFIGNTSGLDKLANYKTGQSLRMQFKQSRAGESKISIMKGGPAWMEFGKNNVKIFNPGEVGALANTYAAIINIDSFKWIAGKQDKHAKEFKFNFSRNNQWDGRWIMGFVPVTEKGKVGRRVWMMRMTKEEKLDTEREKEKKKD